MTRRFWLAEGGFDLERLARVPTTAVDRFFADPERWVRLQPLVIDIRADAERPHYYRVTHRQRLLGIPLRHSYRARIEPKPDRVDAEGWLRPSIHLRNRIRWVADGRHTRLAESVRIEAPRVLLRLALRTARKAHDELLDRICIHLERNASSE